jgi:hypothetical protein
MPFPHAPLNITTFDNTPTLNDTQLMILLAYVKKLKEKVDQENPERGEFMKAKLPALVKKITGNIDKYRFFTGESMDAEGLVVLMDYRDDEVTPFLIVLKDGVFEEKCVCYTQFLQQCKKN